MDENKINKLFGEEACITILLSEYKELLIIKGKYEELSKKETTITWDSPKTVTLYNTKTVDNIQRDMEGKL